MKFAVITTNSFDSFVPVRTFRSLKKAKEYLKETYEIELRIDVEQNGYNVTSHCDEDSAEIIRHFPDHDDVTRFFIGDII